MRDFSRELARASTSQEGLGWFVVRWGVIGMLGVYTVLSAIPAYYLVLYKLNGDTPPGHAFGQGAAELAYLSHYPALQLFLWCLSILFYAVTIFRLVNRRAGALRTFVIGWAVNAAQIGYDAFFRAEYRAAFPLSARMSDYALLALILGFGVLIAVMVERRALL